MSDIANQGRWTGRVSDETRGVNLQTEVSISFYNIVLFKQLKVSVAVDSSGPDHKIRFQSLETMGHE